MEKGILEAFQTNIMERLGESYSQNSSYKVALGKEKDLSGRLRDTLTEEQMSIVEEYHTAISATMDICELLAYRQGMRDIVTLLYGR